MKNPLKTRLDKKCKSGEDAEDLGSSDAGRGDRDGREHGGDHHAWQQQA